MGKRVLILSASAGAGHVRAAEALLKDFQRHPAVDDVQHWDILKYTNAVFRTIYSRVYLDLVNRAPWLLGMVYKHTDKPWKEGAAQAFEKFNARPFIKALTHYQPDLVVCTHFTPPNIISWLNARKKLKLDPAIVVTDLDCHAMWLTRSYSHYFVSLPETQMYLERMGIDHDKISVSGIPVDPVFREVKDKAAARRTLGLRDGVFTVLVSAGGFGVGPVEILIHELLSMKLPAQVVAIAGRSDELKAKLERLAKKSDPQTRVTIHPVGFTKQMDEYMAASDILISKPGGLTTSEAMARGLPMCVVNPIPGQEERNSDHLLEAGVAIKCNNPPTLAWKLERLAEDTERLHDMRRRAAAFGRPRAGEEIVARLLGHV
ncbi:MAG TPA: glycosyltransferase [Phycisphaerae bacterium]|nr:glycosyltransferase [Phycisphaerae bacterium]